MAAAWSIQRPLHRHAGAIPSARGPELFERGIRTVLNPLIPRRKPLSAEQGEAMAPGPERGLFRCGEPRQPALKRPDVHAM